MADTTQKRKRRMVSRDNVSHDDLLKRGVRRGVLVVTLGVTNLNPDGSAMSKSRRKKRRLMKSQGLNISFSQHYKEGPTKRTIRKAKKHIKMLKRNALCSPCGPNRPMSGLDEQAVALGIYSDTFHLLNRIDRKSKVSTALSAQRQAA